jgi:hypothetical protein
VSAWVTWSADVLTFPGVHDITANLDRAVELLARSRDVDAASHDYRPGARRVRFRLRVRYGISELPVKGSAKDALWQCLPGCGLGLDTRHVGPHMAARLRLECWPDDFDWCS